jgi:hypothetical protein
MTTRFVRDTVVKLLGGDLLYREPGQSLTTARETLRGIRRRALDLRRPFQMFRPIWQDSIRKVFAAEGLPAPWPELSPAYAAWKSKKYPGKPMMRATDRLYESLVADTRDTIWEATPRTIRFGTRVQYFGPNQRGVPSRNLPRRPTLVLLPEVFSELARMATWYVAHGEEGMQRGRR